MEHWALLQCGPHSSMESILKVHHILELHDVSEQVAIERRILREQVVQIERALSRH